MAQDPNITVGKIERLDSKRVNAISQNPSEEPDEMHSQKFSSIMNNPSAQIQAQHVVKQQQEVQKVSAPSPMEMAEQVDRDQRHNNQTAVKSLDELGEESRKNLQKVVDSKRTLEANPKIDFSKEDVRKATRSLTHVDESLKIALSKVGSDKYIAKAASPTSPVNPAEVSTPVHKFLGYLTNTQYQFEHLNEQIDFLSSSGGELTLGNMMALQMKMSIISNQLDFFTGILSKSLEATKTIMNIQV